jgi:hypothetical protein
MSRIQVLARTVRITPLAFIMTGAVALMAWGLAAGVAPARGADDAADKAPSADDLAQVQGLWERRAVPASEQGVVRATKDIRGSREVITYYGEGDKVLRRHLVDVKLSRAGDAHVFTWSNMEVTEGEGKGEKSTESGSYLYRVKGEQFREASGLLPGDGDEEPRMLVWTRSKTTGDAAAAAARIQKAAPTDQKAPR